MSDFKRGVALGILSIFIWNAIPLGGLKTLAIIGVAAYLFLSS
jgi:hypothetical protein